MHQWEDVMEQLHNATSFQSHESKHHTTDDVKEEASNGEKTCRETTRKTRQKNTCAKCHRVVCKSCTWKVEITPVDCELLIHKYQWKWCIVFVPKTTQWQQVSPFKGEYFHYDYTAWYFHYNFTACFCCSLKQTLLFKLVCFPAANLHILFLWQSDWLFWPFYVFYICP